MKKVFTNFKTEIYVLLGLFVAWKAWPIVSSIFSLAGTVTETASKAAAGATANIQITSQLAQDQAKLRTLWPGATEAQIAELRSDARGFASLLGTQSGKWSLTTVLPDMQGAFSLAKSKYSRYLLHGNKPFDRNTLKMQTAVTSNSAKRARNLDVLQPFYDEYTGGNSLMADMKRLVFGKDTFKPYEKWIL